MKSIKDYMSGESETTKVDSGLLALAKKEKENTGVPVKVIMDKALFEYLVKNKKK